MDPELSASLKRYGILLLFRAGLMGRNGAIPAKCFYYPRLSTFPLSLSSITSGLHTRAPDGPCTFKSPYPQWLWFIADSFKKALAILRDVEILKG